MNSVVRVGDSSRGHGLYPPTNAAQGSSTLLVDGKEVVREGDRWSTHCTPTIPPSCHSGAVRDGSSVLYVDGIPVARVNDKLSCGDTAATGSPTLYSK